LKQAGKKKKISKSFSYTKLRDTRQTPTKTTKPTLTKKEQSTLYCRQRARKQSNTPKITPKAHST
jgi:hypothetical protein